MSEEQPSPEPTPEPTPEPEPGVKTLSFTDDGLGNLTCTEDGITYTTTTSNTQEIIAGSTISKIRFSPPTSTAKVAVLNVIRSNYNKCLTYIICNSVNANVKQSIIDIINNSNTVYYWYATEDTHYAGLKNIDDVKILNTSSIPYQNTSFIHLINLFPKKLKCRTVIDTTGLLTTWGFEIAIENLQMTYTSQTNDTKYSRVNGNIQTNNGISYNITQFYPPRYSYQTPIEGTGYYNVIIQNKTTQEKYIHIVGTYSPDL